MRILIVEDDKELCEAVSVQLNQEGYEVDLCHNGEDALYYISHSYDIIILDRMLPGLDGLSILREMRNQNILTPVILVTALGSISDRVDGLDSGADDYLAKPFAPEELMARIRALARRPKILTPVAQLQFANIRLDTDLQVLESDVSSCTLSKKETALLEFFMRNRGQTLSREMIMSRVWGPDSFIESGNIDNYIHFLRRRLKSVKSKAFIKTIHSVGYRLEEDPC